MDRRKKKAIVVGAGLVGSLEACILAKRGYDVHLYEQRDDIRTMVHVPGRSINLAMSNRARTGLREVGVEEDIIRRHGIPMKARMIHNKDGSTKAIPYNKDGKCIFSVGRRFVNEVLLSRAERFPNVKVYFQHKMVDGDLENGSVTFERSDSQGVQVKGDLIVGCDGAYSAVRREMLKQLHFNYNQRYVIHAYMELCIPETSDGKFAMPENYLHIWPRGQYMMIALPNQDRTWTVTLFMPLEIFHKLATPELLLEFFQENYPDAIYLIGRERLVKDFFDNTPQAMMTVKCSPYHVTNKAVILGDAAHAMVPFYGQGMNCGMEDCVILDGMMEKYMHDLGQVLPAYSEYRNPDAEAIIDLALYNYVEMRHLVNSRAFLWRKFLDDILYTLIPRYWVPLYTMVTFSRERYHLCIQKKEWQDKILRRLSMGCGLAVLACAMAWTYTESAREIASHFAAKVASLPSLIQEVGLFKRF